MLKISLHSLHTSQNVRKHQHIMLHSLLHLCQTRIKCLFTLCKASISLTILMQKQKDYQIGKLFSKNKRMIQFISFDGVIILLSSQRFFFLFSKQIYKVKMKVLSKYPPVLFHSNQAKDAFKIATKTKFSNLSLLDSTFMDVVFNPFFNLYAQTGKKQFYGHLAKVNPLYKILTQKNEVKCQLVFNASDAYISPIVYKQKQISHNVVPTWNYVAAQFRGVLKMVPQQQLQSLLQKQVQIFEKQVDSEWRLSDSSVQYVEKLKKSIFGIKIEVDYWKAHFKLSQNKSQQDLKRIREWSETRTIQDKRITNWMDEFSFKHNQNQQQQ